MNEGDANMEQLLEVCVELILDAGQELERVVTGTVQTESNTAAGKLTN